ncbi:MAG: VOC family protein [Saprospiraceae bacterium]|nr:VOC family protein [Bacteroidia bacterium]NNE15222.1 VOC family protein [Saprospiraceae bacterium]NNL93589.1 VOC family protein [Saprospiraceae bacterium]
MEGQKTLGLRTCIYKVPNLEEAKQWYTKAFNQTPYFDEPFYIGFNIAGYELGLLLEEATNDKKTKNVLTYWGVEDIDQIYNHFLSCDAKAFEAPNNVGGDIMVAGVEDPWGNLIGLIYNPHFTLAK